MKNNNTKTTMGKIGKALFALSFLPIAVLIAVSVYAMFAGGSSGPDLEAFNASFVYWGLAMCAIPVLPAAVIYQIAYIAGNARTRRNTAA